MVELSVVVHYHGSAARSRLRNDNFRQRPIEFLRDSLNSWRPPQTARRDSPIGQSLHTTRAWAVGLY